MGLNVGGIYVRVANGVTQTTALEAVEKYWLKLGAKKSKDDPLSFEPLSLEKNGRLAYLVAPAENDGEKKGEWIAIYDSERYRADPALALHLAKHFDTDVWHYQMTDSVNQAYAKRYGKEEQVIKNAGKVEEVIAPMPYSFLYFNKVREELAKELEHFQFLAFEKIPHRPKAQYSGPSPKQLNSNDLVVRAKQFAEARDAKSLLALIDDHDVFYDVIAPAIDHADLKKPVDAHFVNALSAAALEESKSHCREEIAEAALRVGDEKIFEQAMTMKLPSYMASLLEARATNLGSAGEPLIAFRLLEAVTRAPSASQTSWNNALYFLLKVIRAPGVSKARIDALLAGAEKNGPTNAFIFHNLACAYVMLGKTSEALEAIRNASKYGYPHMDMIRSDTDLAPLHSDPRFAAVFEDKAPAVTSIAHLRVERNKHKLLMPAVGLHLSFKGMGAAPGLADVVADLQNEFPAMFTHYRRSGTMALDPTKKGKVTRDINELRNKKPKYGFEIQYDSAKGEACDLRLEIQLSEKWGGSLLIHLPLALADDPDALFERFVRYASALPFTCGHAGFALTTYEVGNLVGPGTDAEAELLRVAPAYLGLSFTAHQAGQMTNADFLAPGWLTFLGSEMTKRAGKKITTLAAPAVVRELKKNGMVIRAAQKPFVGAQSAPADLGAFPAVLRALDAVLDRKEKGEYAAVEIERWKRVTALP